MKKYTVEGKVFLAKSLNDALALSKKAKDEEFDREYAAEANALEKDVILANKRYGLLKNKSAAQLFKEMGYSEQGDDTFVKRNGIYTRVIEFRDFDDVRYYVLKNGKIPKGWTWTRTKWYDSCKDKLSDSVKDGHISELMKEKVRKKFEEEKDASDKSAKITENGYAFEIIRADGTKLIYRADTGFTHDAEPEIDVDLDFLINDEIEAIDGYRKMIAKTSNPQLLAVLSHILEEESAHVDELRNAQAGNFKVEDSIHDRLGEGKCAPTGIVGLISLAGDAAELFNNVQKNTSDPLYKEKLALAKHKYDEMKNMIAKERQAIDEFDRYWQSHKAEMEANVRAAEKALR